MIENLVFDLDGTLVDSASGIEFALSEAISVVIPNANLRVPSLRTKLGPPIGQIIKEVVPEEFSSSFFDIERNFRAFYDDAGWRKTCLFETSLELLEKLIHSGVRIFIATNKPALPTKQILEFTGISPYITDLICSDYEGKIYHSKGDLLSILQVKYGLNRHNSMMAGDTLSDYQAANTCGIDFVFATYGYGKILPFEMTSPLYSMNQPIGLLEIIFERNCHEQGNF